MIESDPLTDHAHLPKADGSMLHNQVKKAFGMTSEAPQAPTAQPFYWPHPTRPFSKGKGQSKGGKAGKSVARQTPARHAPPRHGGRKPVKNPFSSPTPFI